MDTLTDVLDNIRSSGAIFGRSLMTPPWSIRFADGASMTLVSMLSGHGWVVPDDGEPVPLANRDLAIITGTTPFCLTSDADVRPVPAYVLTEGGACTDASGKPLGDGAFSLGVRTCGTALDAEHALITASYTTEGRIADRLLTALPRVLVVAHDKQRSAPLALFESEIARDEPGQQAVLDRFLDLLLIGVLRDWFALPDSSAPRWYGATADRVVSKALVAMQDDPAAAWTVKSLAQVAQVSRASFARRFMALMGEPPITYLNRWRLCLAADKLSRSDDTVDAIARQVGYSNAYALSAAFKREYGVRPSHHRTMAGRSR
jgi:AraC-like DNA-binding protein